MVGRTHLTITDKQRADLDELARSSDRAEADRARALLWSSEGHSGGVIGVLLGVQADTVRQWRRRFRKGGVAALRRRPKPGKVAWKSPAALAVVEELLAGPVADRPNWTLPRLQQEVRKRAGIAISTSWLSAVMRQKGTLFVGGHATVSSTARAGRLSSVPGCA